MMMVLELKFSGHCLKSIRHHFRSSVDGFIFHGSNSLLRKIAFLVIAVEYSVVIFCVTYFVVI
jgi:hypothetical protein